MGVILGVLAGREAKPKVFPGLSKPYDTNAAAHKKLRVLLPYKYYGIFIHFICDGTVLVQIAGQQIQEVFGACL